MSKFDRIATFVAVIEQNSFAGAAKKLKASPLTITRQISALEAELGMQLIERTTRRLKLTEFGDLYFPEAKKLLEQYQATEDLINQAQDVPTGKLKVTAHSHFARRVIVPHLAEFLEKYPKIHLHLDLMEVSPNFSKENTDLLFGTLGDGAPDLVRRRILSSNFGYFAAPSYLIKFGTPKQPEDLLQHRFITHTLRQPPDLVTFYNHPNLHLKPYLYVNDSETMIATTVNGIGIMKIMEFRVKQYLESGQLVKILEDYQEPDHPLYLYYRAQRYLDPKIRLFIDFFMNKNEENNNK